MKNILIIICMLFTNISLAQIIDSNTVELINKFQRCKNNKRFVNRNSIKEYNEFKIETYSQKDSNLTEFISLCNSKINEINGPFYTDSNIFYTKTINIDSAYMTRVGNIWLCKTRSEDEGFELANDILNKINNGIDFNTFCILYSDDQNKKYDCDLGWVFNNKYVEPFSSEIIKYNKNQVFVVKTKFGHHVVKIIDNSYKTQESITYIKLEIKK